MSFTWDKANRIYRYADGDEVDEDVLYGWVSGFAGTLGATFGTRGRRLQDAVANIDDNGADEFRDAYADWNFQTAEDIRSSYLATAALAFGGFQNATAEQLAIGEEEARRQGGYWSNFIVEVTSGAGLAMLAARSTMYGEGTFANFVNAVRIREGSFGANEERRILGASDHCVDCLEQKALGWVAYGSLKKIGDSVCRTRCRCRFQYRYNNE